MQNLGSKTLQKKPEKTLKNLETLEQNLKP
jgi:hypothetical protein